MNEFLESGCRRRRYAGHSELDTNTSQTSDYRREELPGMLCLYLCSAKHTSHYDLKASEYLIHTYHLLPEYAYIHPGVTL